MGLTRRDLLRLGLIGGAGSLLPLERIVALAAESGHAAAGSYAFGGRSSSSPAVTAFQSTFRVPPVLQPSRTDATTDYYDITMRPARVEILPGLSTTIWGYNGLYPGPTIRARQGRRVVVVQRNLVDANTSVHLHGGVTPPGSDGHPLDVIAFRGQREYEYPNQQPGATLWYHDHADHMTAPNVYRGLAGFYLLEGSDEAALNLPGGEYDVPLLIQDRIFNADGSLSYSGDVHGVQGDVMLVNGAVQPRLAVAARRYRLRLLNGSNHREYDLAVEPPVPLTQIASDGGLLPAPLVRSSVTLAPAERAEVVVDFSGVAIGSSVVLRNRLEAGPLGQLVRFDVSRAAPDPSTVPSSLRALPTARPVVASRNFDLMFDTPRQVFLLNGLGFDGSRVDAAPRLGTSEVWQFTNRTRFMHPMHLHLAQFRVLTRQGLAAPSYEQGLKDTVAVKPFEKVRVLAHFGGFAGRYVFHCHRLEHEDRDMMGQFEVVP